VSHLYSLIAHSKINKIKYVATNFIGYSAEDTRSKGGCVDMPVIGLQCVGGQTRAIHQVSDGLSLNIKEK
jgi:hypothetical protein